MKRRETDGSWHQRRALVRRASGVGAQLRTPFRLPHPAGTSVAHRITFGGGAWIGSGAWFNLNGAHADVRIGRGTVIANDLSISAATIMQIGDGCLVGARCSLVDQLHDYEHWMLGPMREGRTPHFDWAMKEARPVSVGPGSWLGVNVTVLPGVKIGTGCVIGAGAVVTRDVPDWHIAAGVPARTLRRIDRPKLASGRRG
jgi:acetyltransferase-like isoleucine patch superfamily enzyme